jgi:hypothetical protein
MAARNYMLAVFLVLAGCDGTDPTATDEPTLSPLQLQHQWVPQEIFGRDIPPSVNGVGARRKLWFSGQSAGTFAASNGCSQAKGTYTVDPDGQFAATLTDPALKACPGISLVPNLKAVLHTRRLYVDDSKRLHLLDDDGHEIGLYVMGVQVHAD